MRGHRGRHCMVVHVLCNLCLSPLTLWVRTPLRRGVLDTTLCDKVCQWLTTGWWFFSVSSTNKTDRHDITGILLKVALNTIKQTILPYDDSHIVFEILLKELLPFFTHSNISSRKFYTLYFFFFIVNGNSSKMFNACLLPSEDLHFAM
jgi:hypothetical protein